MLHKRWLPACGAGLLFFLLICHRWMLAMPVSINPHTQSALHAVFPPLLYYLLMAASLFMLGALSSDISSLEVLPAVFLSLAILTQDKMPMLGGYYGTLYDVQIHAYSYYSSLSHLTAALSLWYFVRGIYQRNILRFRIEKVAFLTLSVSVAFFMPFAVRHLDWQPLPSVLFTMEYPLLHRFLAVTPVAAQALCLTPFVSVKKKPAWYFLAIGLSFTILFSVMAYIQSNIPRSSPMGCYISDYTPPSPANQGFLDVASGMDRYGGLVLYIAFILSGFFGLIKRCRGQRPAEAASIPNDRTDNNETD